MIFSIASAASVAVAVVVAETNYTGGGSFLTEFLLSSHGGHLPSFDPSASALLTNPRQTFSEILPCGSQRHDCGSSTDAEVGS